MSNYIQGLNVNQIFMPFSLDEIIDGDNPVRGINAVETVWGRVTFCAIII